MIWKTISKLSTILWIGGISFMLIYGALFIENGKVDSTDKKVMVGVLVVMLFVAVVSSIDLTSDGGKKITVKTVIGAIIFLIIFTLYRMTVQF